MGDGNGMIARDILSLASRLGIFLEAKDGRVVCKAPVGVIAKDFVGIVRKHKNELLAELESAGELTRGQCESCPAGVYWNYLGTGRWCFHSAYFLGRTAKAISCLTARYVCPLRNGDAYRTSRKPFKRAI